MMTLISTQVAATSSKKIDSKDGAVSKRKSSESRASLTQDIADSDSSAESRVQSRTQVTKNVPTKGASNPVHSGDDHRAASVNPGVKITLKYVKI
jgi:hypothetical protein